MSRDKIDPKILKKILDNPKTKGMKLQSIRNAISIIHKNNPGITMNGAAHEFAKKKGFAVYRYLNDKDIESLKNLKQTALLQEKVKAPKKAKRIKRPDVDFETPFLSDAHANANVYPFIYILENSLRQVILDKFDEDKGWWEDQKIVPEPVQRYSQIIQNAEKKYQWLKKRGDHPVYYVGLLELFRIIEKNWKEFSNIFENLEQLRHWIRECIPIRNLVAHNIKTRKKERERMETNVDYICRLIAKSRKTQK